jgi:YebC/PmpR family DNA-binding regulatory protein
MGAQWKHAGRLASGAAKGKLFSKLAKEIIIAAKAGPDPTMNPRLRVAVDAAKKASMPKDTLERAIRKGSGLLDETVTYETVTYEGFGPHRVPVIVECLTDNNKRTSTNIKHLFRNGQLSSVAWDFTHVGIVDGSAPEHGGDAEEAAIEAGAQDVELDADGVSGQTLLRFYTEPTDVDAVSKSLTAMGWSVAAMRIGWRPKNPVKVDDASARAEVEKFLVELDDDDDVQHIYVGLIP